MAAEREEKKEVSKGTLVVHTTGVGKPCCKILAPQRKVALKQQGKQDELPARTSATQPCGKCAISQTASQDELPGTALVPFLKAEQPRAAPKPQHFPYNCCCLSLTSEYSIGKLVPHEEVKCSLWPKTAHSCLDRIIKHWGLGRGNLWCERTWSFRTWRNLGLANDWVCVHLFMHY